MEFPQWANEPTQWPQSFILIAGIAFSHYLIPGNSIASLPHCPIASLIFWFPVGRTLSGARPWRVLPPNSPIWCSLTLRARRGGPVRRHPRVPGVSQGAPSA